tara:strand:- start:1523 stop:1861 length:339 start_codon:yes stop_codon:yes gene_type:complete
MKKIIMLLIVSMLFLFGCSPVEPIEEIPIVEGGELPFVEKSEEDVIHEQIIEEPDVKELPKAKEFDMCDYNEDGKVNKIEEEYCGPTLAGGCELSCLNDGNGTIQRACLEGC